MDRTANPAAPTTGRRARIWVMTKHHAPALTGFAIPFALVLYLALRDGGYNSIVRGEVGIAIWCVILLGFATGFLSLRGINRAAWIALGLLTGFLVWTAAAILWSESVERTVDETARVAAYLGVFVLALVLSNHGNRRQTVAAVGTAIALVAAIALLSRLHPAWFPENPIPDHVIGAEGRLAYPLGTWNNLAALIAVGMPIVLTFALQAHQLFIKALAMAALPIMTLAAFLTFSRGGILACVVGLSILIALYPRRVQALPTFGLTGIASTVLIFAASRKTAFESGLNTELAHQQGDEMLIVIAVTLVTVVATRIALGHSGHWAKLEDHGRLQRVTPRWIGATAVTFVVAALLAGAATDIADAWKEFKEPISPGEATERLGSTGGNGRWQFWGSAFDAGSSAPLSGIGPGTFEFWWAREGTISGFIRNAHSLYVETFAELGVVGLALIIALIGFVLGSGSKTIKGSRVNRPMLAGALGGASAFAIAVAIDWGWEVAVLPIAFFLLSAPLLSEADRRTGQPGERSPAQMKRRWSIARWSLVAFALPIILLLTSVVGSARLIESSQSKARSADFSSALNNAEAAETLAPYAATPALQRGLVLEELGDLDSARVAVRAAVDKEPTNWRPWYIMARIAEKLTDVDDAQRYWDKARSLNPRSYIFTTATG